MGVRVGSGAEEGERARGNFVERTGGRKVYGRIRRFREERVSSHSAATPREAGKPTDKRKETLGSHRKRYAHVTNYAKGGACFVCLLTGSAEIAPEPIHFLYIPPPPRATGGATGFLPQAVLPSPLPSSLHRAFGPFLAPPLCGRGPSHPP
jgi:hypothetical protein